GGGDRWDGAGVGGWGRGAVSASAGSAGKVGGLNGPPKRGNPSAFRCPGGSCGILPGLPLPRNAGLLWALLPDPTGTRFALGRSTGETRGCAKDLDMCAVPGSLIREPPYIRYRIDGA